MIFIFSRQDVVDVEEYLEQGGVRLPRVRVRHGRLRHGNLGKKDGQPDHGKDS